MFFDRFLIENCSKNDLKVAQKDVELASKKQVWFPGGARDLISEVFLMILGSISEWF